MMPDPLLLALSPEGLKKILEIKYSFQNIPRDIKEILSDDELLTGKIALTDVIKVLEWFHLKDSSKKYHVTDIVKDSKLILSKIKPQEANPELQERLKRLQAEQDNKEYKRMVSSVSNNKSSNYFGTSPSAGTKSHITSGLNFAVTFMASVFACVYMLQYIVPSLYVRVTIGVVVGTLLLIVEIILALRAIEADVVKSKTNVPARGVVKFSKVD